MYLVRNHQALPEQFWHAIVTIGNFDGVHLGHQQLLKTLKQRAKQLGKACGVIIFEPQPQEFFLKQSIPRLSTLRQKYTLIKQQGIDFMLVLRFNEDLAELTAEDFIAKVLVYQLHISEIWIGQDFRFGHQRIGDFVLLQQQGQQFGFNVQCIPDVIAQNKRISSTLIRALLAEGDLQQAKKLLGHYYSIEGKVINGSARGRTMNMRTANIRPPFQLVPIQGIFVARVGWNYQEWPAVASLGTSPVFAGQSLMLEVHIFNFTQDIYGQHLQVELLHKLRDETDFASVELLQAQMQQDLLAAQHYWKQHHDQL